MSPNEIKDVLKEYLKDELGSLADKVVENKRIDLEKDIELKFKTMENMLKKHIDDKINKITEEVLSLTIKSKIKNKIFNK